MPLSLLSPSPRRQGLYTNRPTPLIIPPKNAGLVKKYEKPVFSTIVRGIGIEQARVKSCSKVWRYTSKPAQFFRIGSCQSSDSSLL